MLDKNQTYIVTGVGLGDTTFDSDVGSWNVSRAIDDCRAGKHKLYEVDVADMVAHNEKIEVDAAKIQSMVDDRERLIQSPPPIAIVENGLTWLIDGHHRVRALHKLGFTKCACFVIEEADGKPYQVYYNGSRVAPWHKKQ